MPSQISKEKEKARLEAAYKKCIEPIQAEMMPSWQLIEANERTGIEDLLKKWEAAIRHAYQRLPYGKQKLMLNLSMNEAKLVKKGAFRFDLNRVYLKKNQIELLNLSSYEPPSSEAENSTARIVHELLTHDHQQRARIRPNTRLILKCFKQFIDAFECLENARLAKLDDLKAYWSHLSKFTLHMSKGILRCCFYVHENAGLKKGAISLPPIYVLESDDCEVTNRPPNVKLELLYEYIYVCRDYLKYMLKYEEFNDEIACSKSQQREILRFYKLVLNCLIRLIQMSTLIRENLIMKKINYAEQNVCDVDVYAHFMGNECRLVREYLKKVLEFY